MEKEESGFKVVRISKSKPFSAIMNLQYKRREWTKRPKAGEGGPLSVFSSLNCAIDFYAHMSLCKNRQYKIFTCRYLLSKDTKIWSGSSEKIWNFISKELPEGTVLADAVYLEEEV